MSGYPCVPLGELLTQVDRGESVFPDGKYRLLGVRLEGNGAFHRETVTGTETSASRLHRVEAGDFIYSRLFAWRGAFGLIGSELDGCYVSNEFPLFRVDNTRLDTAYLNRWFQLPATWRRVEGDCTGSTPTTRNRFKEKFFLELEIPLPTLVEQQTIVAHLDALVDKIRRLTACLDDIDGCAGALVLSTHHKLANGRTAALSELIELHEEHEPVQPGCEYPQVGVRSFGRGLFPKASVEAADTTYRAFNKLYSGAIVLSQVKGWEGALALTPPNLVGRFASPEYRTFRCIEGKACAGYLAELFKISWFWSKLQNATRGVGARRERTRPEQFLNIALPMPKFKDQCKASEVFSHLAKLRTRHMAMREANAALIPATLERLFARRPA